MQRVSRYTPTPNQEPRWALVQEALTGTLRVEPFDPDRHVSPAGYVWGHIDLFTDPAEVAHLRDLITN